MLLRARAAVLSRTLARRSIPTNRAWFSSQSNDAGQNDQPSGAPSNGLLMAAAEGLRVVDIHRPHMNNGIDPLTLDALVPLFEDWRQQGSDVKLVALRGGGLDGKWFSTGTVLPFLYQCIRAGDTPHNGLSSSAADKFFHDFGKLCGLMDSATPPVISMVDGVALGSGVSLALHSSMAIATENTVMSFPEAGFGGAPAPGLSYKLSRLPGGVGPYLALAGPRLLGRDNVAAGIATHFIRSSRLEHLEGVIVELARQALANNTRTADMTVVETAIRSLDKIDVENLPPPTNGEKANPVDEESYIIRCAAELQACFGSADTGFKTTADEIVALVNEEASRQTAQNLASAKLGVDPKSEWADPGLNWAISAARALELASPTSLAVTLELLRRGSLIESASECFEMETGVSRMLLQHSDFMAGVEALAKYVVQCSRVTVFTTQLCEFDCYS